ncbi:hypothetical protein P3X46_029836 [Hevea brasiliensis]|uniref:C2H2-type domain-containing protein n=1 Tax=Hevea brasiliensis TaxID=3981 RepID=A0ABQ9KTY0_HEVBR|nr:zinc finger protein ZAT4 [Hevea brasiliensis]KAJ9147710.1 hypothetical protein P3X46_029836 [Hevea brasiliensis]
MEKHKCKLCTRTFANGRALGGHMKAHLATLPLPPKTTLTTQQQLGDRTESASSSYSSSGAQREREIKNREVEEKALVYGLRENPKKSFRFADPEFSFAVDAGSLVQDRESETESRNPTRIRSKRTRKSGFAENQKQNFDIKKLKLKNPSSVEAPAEPEPVSSVSDTSPEEDVAMCLMMLSRDVWMRNNEEEDQEQGKDGERSTGMMLQEAEEIKVSKIRGKLRCEKCMKLFRSSQALGTHKRICSLNGTELRNNEGNERIFECPYCFKVFGSGQALGGHKRSHLMGTSTPSAAENSVKLDNNLIDLNLPAPTEDDDFSVVSDA